MDELSKFQTFPFCGT